MSNSEFELMYVPYKKKFEQRNRKTLGERLVLYSDRSPCGHLRSISNQIPLRWVGCHIRAWHNTPLTLYIPQPLIWEPGAETRLRIQIKFEQREGKTLGERLTLYSDRSPCGHLRSISNQIPLRWVGCHIRAWHNTPLTLYIPQPLIWEPGAETRLRIQIKFEQREGKTLGERLTLYSDRSPCGHLRSISNPIPLRLVVMPYWDLPQNTVDSLHQPTSQPGAWGRG